MRFLILSDIHGNLPALEAVLENAVGEYDEVVCLGDIVGYGAFPNEVTRWTWRHANSVIRGNHDRAATGDPVVDEFSENAHTAAIWTREELLPECADWLAALPKGPQLVDSFYICHGSPRDEDEYIVGLSWAADLYPDLPGEITFFGHTHLQGGYAYRPGRIWPVDRAKRAECERTHSLEADTYYFLNPGSVGQPRDFDPRAAFALYDSSQRVIEFRRAAYDIPRAQQQILKYGLPAALAHRLADGH